MPSYARAHVHSWSHTLTHSDPLLLHIIDVFCIPTFFVVSYKRVPTYLKCQVHKKEKIVWVGGSSSRVLMFLI